MMDLIKIKQLTEDILFWGAPGLTLRVAYTEHSYTVIFLPWLVKGKGLLNKVPLVTFVLFVTLFS
jgi:hypothetical protein